MVQPRAFRMSDGIERIKLTYKELPDFLVGQLLRPPAETLAVIEPRVGTNRDAVARGERDGRSHTVCVARMKSAGHVGGRDHSKQRLVGLRISLPDVSVQVELSHPPRFCQAFDNSKDADWSSDETLPASKMLQRSASDPAIVHTAAAADNDRRVRPWRRIPNL